MHKSTHALLLVFSLLSCLLLVTAGCSPAAKQERHLERADRHFAADNYEEAEIEYKNVLQLEPQHAAALGRLGQIYQAQNRLLPARSLLQRAVALQPENTDLQVALGQTDLAIGDSNSARAKAEAALARQPDHPQAPLLLAQSAMDDAAIKASTELLGQLPGADRNAVIQLALGLMKLKQGQTEAAEADVNRALTLDPKLPEAHTIRGTLAMRADDLGRAEAAFKQAAELAPARSALRLQYPQFKIQQGKVAEGRALVEAITTATPDYLPAWMVLANLASTEKKYDESLALVDRVLARDNLYPDALLLRPRLHMAKADFTKAIEELNRALQIFPTSPQFLYQAGLAHVATGDVRPAMDHLQRALAQAPGFIDAKILLASLQLQTGDHSAAISQLNPVIQARPDMIQPRLMLADAFRARNDPAQAIAIYEQIDQDFPGNPRTPLLQGMVLLQQRNLPAARAAFAKALERAPDFLPAIEQLVTLDLVDKQFDAAKARIESQLIKQPEVSELHLQLARALVALRDYRGAEAALQRAIELNPAVPAPYFVLANLYALEGRQEDALAHLEKILVQNPTNAQALLMSGMLQEQLGRLEQALATYEKLLTVDPRSGIALNNSAVLYAEHFNQLDRAYATAQKARELYPLDPHVADTFGWILVQRGQYAWARTLLQESAARLPNSATIHYHLGVAHYQMGEEAAAARALAKALELDATFAGAAEARQRMELLQLDPAADRADAQTLLTTALRARPDDPIALARQAALQEQTGQFAAAIATYQKILSANPGNLPVVLNLIRLRTDRGELPQALEVATNARKIAPDNAALNLALGQLAYRTRDYPWAFSLLQEYQRRQPEDGTGQRALARAAYMVGQVDEARAAMNRALQLEPLSPANAVDRQFLELISLADDPAAALATATTVEQALQADPDHLPAIMAAATIREHQADFAAAITHYERALTLSPNFLPAQRRLAILLATVPGDTARAFDLVLKARTAYPDDQALAKAYGIILHRREDFTRALTLLTATASRRPDDAEVLYYLGLTQHRLKDHPGARQSLQRALELNLPSGAAADARRILAEIK